MYEVLGIGHNDIDAYHQQMCRNFEFFAAPQRWRQVQVSQCLYINDFVEIVFIEGIEMQLGMIGLGRMGGNIVRRLLRGV